MADQTPTSALFFKPTLMERVWGGNKLGNLFGPGKAGPSDKVIGESWELSDRPEGESIVSGGPYDGSPLSELRNNFPEAILGEKHKDLDRFPLLIKYIDAAQPLSIQVHPDDDQAAPFGDRGKSECWVVLHAEPDSKMVRGLKPNTTEENFAEAVKNKTVEDIVESFSVKPGDLLAIPPGMIHAIGKGIVVAEIQQSSNITYRVWDYERLGLDGKPRELHVKQAQSVIRYDHPGDEFEGDLSLNTTPSTVVNEDKNHREERMLRGRFFSLWRWTLPNLGQLNQSTTETIPEAPTILMALEGKGRITVNNEPPRDLVEGDTVLLPAGTEDWSIQSAENSSLITLASQPGPE